MKFLKPVILTICSFVVLAFTAQLCFTIAEKYFFDKVFYKKSALHGYGSDEWNNPFDTQNKVLRKRKSDVEFLLQGVAGNEAFYYGSCGVSAQRDDQEFVVAVIGDSMVYGAGVRKEQAFPAVLEKKLRKTIPHVKVYNFSISGDTIIDNYAKYLLAKRKVNPDIYILGIFINDLYIDQVGKYYNSHLKKELDSSCLYKEFSNAKYTDWTNVPFDTLLLEVFFPSFFDATCNYHYLVSALNTMSFDKEKVLFMAFAPIEDQHFSEQEILQMSWVDSAQELHDKNVFIMGKYVDTIRSHGFSVIAPATYLPSVSLIEGHPSTAAHEYYATMLEKRIIDMFTVR